MQQKRLAVLVHDCAIVLQPRSDVSLLIWADVVKSGAFVLCVSLSCKAVFDNNDVDRKQNTIDA